jgi:hypothetical protein
VKEEFFREAHCVLQFLVTTKVVSSSPDDGGDTFLRNVRSSKS